MSLFELPDEGPVHLTISHVGGDLRLRGWERRAIASKDNGLELVEHEPGVIAASAAGDVSLRVPYDAAVTVDSVGGDVKITDLDGQLTLGHVGGDLNLRKVGPVTASHVGSDLRLKRAGGDVQIGHVGADATIREVEGDTLIEQVGADLYVRDVTGACRAAHVGADLVLSTDFSPAAAYAFTVGGDIVCRVPADASVRVRVPADSDLNIDAPGAAIEEGDDTDDIVFGEGDAVVELRAGGEIRLVGQDEDYMMAINFQLAGDLEDRLAGLEEHLSEQLAGLDELIAEKAERIRDRAARQAERAVRRAERVARKSRKRGFRFVIGDQAVEFGGPRPARPPRPPAPPTDPVTDDERLMILKMVEAGKITVEEAEKLLAALEGR